MIVSVLVTNFCIQINIIVGDKGCGESLAVAIFLVWITYMQGLLFYGFISMFDLLFWGF